MRKQKYSTTSLVPLGEVVEKMYHLKFSNSQMDRNHLAEDSKKLLKKHYQLVNRYYSSSF